MDVGSRGVVLHGGVIFCLDGEKMRESEGKKVREYSVGKWSGDYVFIYIIIISSGGFDGKKYYLMELKKEKKRRRHWEWGPVPTWEEGEDWWRDD